MRRRLGATETSHQSQSTAPDSTPPQQTQSSVHRTEASVFQNWNLVIFAFIAFLLPAVVYLRTLNAGLAGGDSGELIVSAYQFSVPHPPGYPTFMALGWLWIHFLPLPGSVAYRANMLSAIESALAAMLLFLAIVELIVSLTNKKPSLSTLCVSLFGSLLYSFSSIVWMYSLHAEVFPLNNAMCAAVLFLTFKYLRTKETSHAIWGSFLCGLALTNQHTLLVYEIMIIPWILFIGRSQLVKLRQLGLLGASFLLGFSPYCLLFLSQSIRLNKYSWGDLLTFEGYFTHLTRAEYGSFQLYKGDINAKNPEYLLKLQFYFDNLVSSEYGYSGVCLAALGILYSFSSWRRQLYSIPLFACFLFYITWFFDRCNLPLDDPLLVGVWHRFFPQLNMLLAIWAAVGLFAVNAALKQKKTNSRLFLNSAVLAAVVVLIGIQLQANFVRLDQSQNHYIEAYGKSILEPLPNNSIVLLKGDLEANSASYYHLVEGVRPDLTLLSVNHMTYDWWGSRQKPLYPHIKWPGNLYHPYKPGGFSISQFLDANIDQYPIVAISGWKTGDDTWKDKTKWFLARYGIGERVFPSNYLSRGASSTKTEEDRKIKIVEKKFKATVWPSVLDRIPRAHYPQYGAESWELRLLELVSTSRANVAYQWLLLLTDLDRRESSPIYEKILLPTIVALEETIADVRNFTWMPQQKTSELLAQNYRNLGIAWDSAHKILAASGSTSWRGYSQAQIIRRVVDAWESYLIHRPKDKSIREAVEYWKSRLSKL